MSKEAVKQVAARMVSDETFREQVKSDIEIALRGYDLTPEERMELAKQDASDAATGLDDRKSKARSIWDPKLNS